MRSLDYDLVFTDDVGNIVGVILGDDRGSTTVVTSHMDTVIPDRLESWDRSPFSGDIVHGRIEGVGAADCKGGLAAQIYAGQALLAASQHRLKGNIIVVASVAEESGCSTGVRHLLETTLPELGMDPKFVILGEPTGLRIGTGHDGWVSVDVSVFSPVEAVARSAGEHVFEILNADCDDGSLPGAQTIMEIDQPKVVFAGNQCRVTVRVHRRLFPGESAEDVVRWLDGPALEMAREMHAVGIDVAVHEEEQQLYSGHTRRVRLFAPPWSTNLMHPLVCRAREAMLGAGCRWAPNHWRLDRLGTGTAGGVVSREFGIPVIGYGPGEEEQAHACNESVSLRALVDAVFGTAVLMNGLSAVPMTLPTEAVHLDAARIVASAGEGREG
jgi:acetylornithine deacetylase/succinyl-diaminopimelate desuccinylase-like protein